jgi:site-specific DNA recombinase
MVGVPQSTAALPLAAEILRVAVLARTSTDDLQDPTISIPRQVNRIREALPENAQIVAFYWDVESGRTELSKRGMGNAHEKFDIPVPRTGGIKDLLRDAAENDRAFDVVMCESIDRVARITYYSTRLEHLLEEQGVALLAADEPIVVKRRKLKNATAVLTRRVKQGISEWYVLDLLEKSWGGFETHAQQGYNVGKALYGFKAHRIPHPVPDKRAAGRSKTTLVVDEPRAAVVRRIFEMRVGQRLGYQAIAENLNKDLELNPPPIPPDPARARGNWGHSAVREILKNPKYTGYMVWNRVTCTPKGNRPNPVSEWVWSPEPVHEAIVTPEVFSAAQAIGSQTHRKRSKQATTTAKNEYRFRSVISCGLCGLSMYGKPREDRIYYSCHPKPNMRPEGHPPATYLNEKKVSKALDIFIAAFLLGAERTGRLQELLDQAQTEGPERLDREREAVRAALVDLDARRANLVQVLEVSDDLDGELIKSVAMRQQALSKQRKELVERMAAIEQEIAARPDLNLVVAIPACQVEVERLPADLLRRLLQAFHIKLAYQPITRELTCAATISRTLTPTVQELVKKSLKRPKVDDSLDDGETCGSVTSPGWDSNPHCTGFESVFSASWNTGPGSGLAGPGRCK